MIKRLLFAIALIIMVLTLIDCKKSGDPEPNAEDVQLEKLTATWNCTQVTRDGITQDGYTNFKLMISGTPGSDTFNYSCTGRPSLGSWPANGTFAFGATINTDLVRDGSVPVSYSVTDSQLELTFNYQGSGFPARTEIVNGTWVFKFSK